MEGNYSTIMASLPEIVCKTTTDISHIDNEIFGPTLISQNKRILTCLPDFANVLNAAKEHKIIVWEFQRALKNDRVTEIYAFYRQEYENQGMVCVSGQITMCKVVNLMFDEDIYHVIDGQHRFYALMKLLVDGVNEVSSEYIKVKVEIILVQSRDEIRTHFVNINKSVPVPLEYLRPADIVNLCCNKLEQNYIKVFTDRKRRPSINKDAFKNTLLASKLLTENLITNADQLYILLMDLNDYYDKKGCGWLQDRIARRNKAVRKQVLNWYWQVKQDKKCLMMGLFKLCSDWIDDLIDQYNLNIRSD